MMTVRPPPSDGGKADFRTASPDRETILGMIVA
jgi:hypothetical protein